MSHFDRVLSSIMIHHLKTPDKIKTAQEVFRVLKPGGQLHIIDFGKPSSPGTEKCSVPSCTNSRRQTTISMGKLPEIFGAPG